MSTLRSFFIDLLRKFTLGAAFMGGVLAMAITAQTVSGTVNTFNQGDTPSASRINENFASLKSAIESISIPSVPATGWSLNTTLGLAERAGSIRNRANGFGIYNQPSTAGSTFDIVWYDAPDDITSGNYRWDLTYRGSLDNHKLVLINQSQTFGVTFTQTGLVGFGADPVHPLQMASGAHVTSGGVWTSVSSRATKNAIKELDARRAMRAFNKLKPVNFEYKKEPGNQYLGFIAEDVPGLVSTPDRKGVAAMDIAALLTRVVQKQDKDLKLMRAELRDLKHDLKSMKRAR